MKTILDLIFLSIIICFIVDVSGVMSEIRKLVSSIIFKKTKIKVDYRELKLRPIGCSLCSIWWCGLIYLLITNNFTIPYIALVSFLSLISSNISGFLFCIKDILAVIEGLIQKLIQKFTL
jgi:hypothetical protein